MSKHFSIIRILLTVALMGGHALTGQEADKQVDVLISVIVWHDRPASQAKTIEEMEAETLAPEAGNLNRIIAGKEGREVLTISEGTGSQPFRYVGPPVLTLYSESRNSEGAVVLQPREQVILPEKTKSGLLLAIRAGGTDENPTFRLAFVDSSTISADDKGILFYNLSRKPIAVRTGGAEAITLEPTVRKWVELEESRRSVPLRIAAYDDSWKLVYNSVSRMPLSGPALALVLNQPGSADAYRVSIISLPATEKEELPDNMFLTMAQPRGSE